jgi:hypothetical protein
MGLEDFERNLLKDKADRESRKPRERSRSRSRERRKDRHHHSKHHSSKRRHRDDDGHRSSKRRRPSNDGEPPPSNLRASDKGQDDEDSDDIAESADAVPVGEDTLDEMLEQAADKNRERDAWMQAPSSIGVDYVQRKKKESPKPKYLASSSTDYSLKLHKNELNRQLHDIQDDDNPAPREINYIFGDAGSDWRMKKLENVFSRAKQSGRPVEDVAMEIYGDLEDFYDAREEQQEVDRRKMYGEGYKGREKPSGELFRSRQKRSVQEEPGARGDEPVRVDERGEPGPAAVDQSTLNRLKAQMMKAKLRGAPDAAKLEAEYNKLAAAGIKPSNVVVLNAMENRMLTGGRKGEVEAITTKRGRDRGQVKENEDMTIEDMVRQERRTKGYKEGLLLAEKISKDGKFTDNLDYLDENAEKLATRVQKSDANLRSTAIGDYQKMKQAIDSCPLCHHEDKGTPPVAPLVALGTRVFLTLATEPEVSEGGACIVPVEHHANLLECDEDEWEEMRNFMKCLTRMYHEQGREVLFYENAASPQKRRHAAMQAVPLPYSVGETAPAFFREAMLVADEEWAQHKKVLDTGKRAREGLGRMAFRRTLVKEMPYFHVWFDLDGGLGHVVEDEGRWPKGDLFAREVIGGMLDVEAAVVKRQGRWQRGDRRLEGFRKRFRKFDWTRVLTEET